jgi:UDP-2,3-diacylglucosamine pyrophosphatase LpxH
MTKSGNEPADPTPGQRGDGPSPGHGGDRAAVPDVEEPPEIAPPPRRAIQDVLEITVDSGHRVVCVSDLHLRPTRTDASAWAASVLIKALDSMAGPATLVLVGDVLELWFIQPPDGPGSLGAHADLVQAIARFRAEPGRRVVYVLGNHDARLAWDGALLTAVHDRLGCEFAFAAELVAADRSGGRIRVEHGHAHDPANAFHDPRDPRESPLGMHLVEEILPDLHFMERGALEGMDALSNPRTFPGFLSSRYFYRRVLGIAGWIVVPLALLYLARILASLILIATGQTESGLHAALGQRFLGLDTLQLAVLVGVTLVAVQVARRGWRQGSEAVAERRGSTQNANTRSAAERLVERGYAGMVAAHTHRCELTEVGTGFYVNTGSCTKVIDRVRARLHLPSVYLPRLQLSWVTIELVDGWRVDLIAARRSASGASRLERLAARSDQRNLAADPSRVARFPGGPFLAE